MESTMGTTKTPPKKRNERTSKRVAKVAGKVLKKGKATPKQARTLAASALTQAPDKPKKKGKK